jgi:hypothetical protein
MHRARHGNVAAPRREMIMTEAMRGMTRGAIERGA